MYCSKKCNSAAYKAKIRDEKVNVSNQETHRIKTQSIEGLKAKEFLTVRDVATLLNSSIRTVYRLIEQGNIKAVNIAERKTLVKRSDLDKLFDKPLPERLPTESKSEPIQYDISECLNLTEVQSIYGISETALQQLIKRFGIPKIKIGRFAYVPKILIDKQLS
jgi:excisionase family DNA binding protein